MLTELTLNAIMVFHIWFSDLALYKLILMDFGVTACLKTSVYRWYFDNQT